MATPRGFDFFTSNGDTNFQSICNLYALQFATGEYFYNCINFMLYLISNIFMIIRLRLSIY